MEFDCTPDSLFHLLDRIANRYAARQVRDIGSVIPLTLLDNDDVLHVYLLFLQPGLFEDAIQCAFWHVFAEMPADSDASLFRRMFVLTMIALGANVEPAILFDHLDNISHFHET